MWAFQIVRPFIEPVIWGVIIAVAVMPIHQKVAKRLGGRPKLAATLFALLGLALLIIPTETARSRFHLNSLQFLNVDMHTIHRAGSCKWSVPEAGLEPALPQEGDSKSPACRFRALTLVRG